MSAIYYVYAFLHEDGEPYYIGKGKEARAYRQRDPNVLIPPQDRVLILLDSLTERTAFIHERNLIAHYGRIDMGTGILYNKTAGGEGTANPSPETRAKLSKINKGKVTPPATRDKIRTSVLALKQTDTHVSASCIYCRKTIRTTPEAIALNIEQHIYYKHKDIASSWKPANWMIPVSCLCCRQVIKTVNSLEQHYKKHKSG